MTDHERGRHDVAMLLNTQGFLRAVQDVLRDDGHAGDVLNLIADTIREGAVVRT